MGGARGAQVLSNVTGAAHPHERAGDDREPADERDGALRVARESGQGLAHLLRKLARQLRLEKRGARDYGDAELGRSLEDGEGAVVDALRGCAHRFAEREIHRQLYRLKVMTGTGDVACELHEHGE